MKDELLNNEFEGTMYRNDAAKKYFDKINSQFKMNKIVPVEIYKKKFNEIYKDIVCETTTVEKYYNTLKADPELCNLILELLEWYFSDSPIGGFLICSRPGVGKTQISRALRHISFDFQKPYFNVQGKFTYVSLDQEISNHLKGNEGIDLSFSMKENIILDDMSEKLNSVKTYSYEHSLNDFFKSRYEMWQRHGCKTVIMTNMICDLDYEVKDGLALNEFLDTKTIERVRQQFKIITLIKSKSKR